MLKVSVQTLLEEFFNNDYSVELYHDMVESGHNSSSCEVLYFLKENNCLCNDESQTIQPEFLYVVNEINDIFNS